MLGDYKDLSEFEIKKSLLKRVWIAFFSICLGALIGFTLPTGGSFTSFVYRFQGEVTIFNPDLESWDAVKVGDFMHINHRIKTASDSWAEVRLDDGSLLRMGPNTEIRIISLFVNPMMGIRSARWEIMGVGNIYINTKIGSIYEVQTPKFIASVSQGTMRVNGDSEGNFTIKVPDKNSKATIQIGNITTQIPPEQQAKITSRSEFSINQASIDESDVWNSNMDMPDLQVDYPLSTSEERIKVKGKTNPGNMIFLNDVQQTKASSDGTFQLYIDLLIGKVKHKISSMDQAFRSVEKTIEIERIEQGTHQLNITTPKDGMVTNEKEIEITGTIEGSTLLVISGKEVAIKDGTFSIKVILLSDGLNTIVIKSFDKKGREIRKTLNINYEVSKPDAKLSIETPFDGFTTEEVEVTITGSTDASAVYVGNRIGSISNGRFTIKATLDLGRNAIVVTARDDTKKSTSKTVVVYRSKHGSIPPIITITNYDHLTNKNSTTISGTTKNTRSIQTGTTPIDINSDGSFSINVKLNEGLNEIAFNAISNDGGTGRISIIIICDTKPPDLNFLKAIRVIGETQVVFQGQVEHGSVVWVNGIRIYDIQPGKPMDSIMYKIDNLNGKSISIRARDEAGNESTREIIIESATPRNP